MKKLMSTPSIDDMLMAHHAIQTYIHRTPVMTNQSIDSMTNCQIHFKCENFQKIGAFKMRGAACFVEALSDIEKSKGLGTHSSGNHAQAVARAAKINGIPAHIVMPADSPKIKIAAVRDYGAQIHFSEANQQSRESTMKKVLAETGVTFIHPYDHDNIIAGQSTACKELLEEVDNLDIVIAPIGGGGLMSGTSLWTKYNQPNIQVFGAEPLEVNDAYRSVKLGKLVTNETINTIADGLRTNLSERTFEIIKTHVDHILTCSESAIVQALRVIWERMKIIIEPSCAVPLACIMEHPEYFRGKRIGMILSGGNVDLEKISGLLNSQDSV